ncbi:MAG: DUF2029 domain-containing protein [Candidatus Omnitrophica bacterium]|nr:DUF2029 domain-containing protein [Candidatus Omnitrophota bacterium]
MHPILKKIITSNYFFVATITLFIIALGLTAVARGGRDLKVGLFGVEQVIHKKSPYDNPLDHNRVIFRYAPAFTLLQYPYLLKSKMTAPFEFSGITTSIIAWYLTVILSLFVSGWLLTKIMPAVSPKTSFMNLKISFLLCLPAIGYELSNGQNKLFSLCLMFIAIYLFEKKRFFFSSIFFNLAITVYIPLVFFAIYFILKSKGRYIFSLINGCLLIFIILPSLIFGFEFNLYLLKDWFIRCLKPFFFADTYATYIDLRTSSHSLPSAIGRMFVSGFTGAFNYRISPILIHILIMTITAIILLVSCLVAWINSKENCRGLLYAIFLILALILPAYCIYYTWAWLFVAYFAVFSYLDSRETFEKAEKILAFFTGLLVIASWLFSLPPFNHLSFLFWATFLFWLNLVLVIFNNNRVSLRITR